MIFFYKKDGEILLENFNDTHKINFSDAEISAAQDALNLVLSNISNADDKDHNPEIDAVISEHKLPTLKEISGDALKNYIIDNNLASFDINDTDYFIWEDSLPSYYDVDFLNKTLIILPTPAPDYTEKIKIECGRRIFADVDENAQKNLLAHQGMLLTQNDQNNQDELDLIVSVTIWISQMRQTCASLIASQVANYADDSHWPALSSDAKSLVARF